MTLALIVKDKSYFKYFKNKNIKGSLTKKVFSYIEENEENKKNAKEQYIKQYQEKGTVKLQHLSFGQSSLLQKLSELMNM